MAQWIFDLAREKGFVDPLTKRGPRKEAQLTSLLAYYHQKEAIKWEYVPIRPAANPTESREVAGSLLAKPGFVISEYQFFYEGEDQEKKFGSMSADLLYVTSDLRRVTLLENKVGAAVGRKKDASLGLDQFGCQLEYLRATLSEDKHLILLSSEDYLKRGWYINEFRQALQHDNRASHVSGHLMTWEDLIRRGFQPVDR